MNDIDVLLGPLRVFLAEVASLVPRLLLAIVIVLAGWLLLQDMLPLSFRPV